MNKIVEPYFPIIMVKLSKCMEAVDTLYREFDILAKESYEEDEETLNLRLKTQLRILAEYLESKGISCDDVYTVQKEINEGLDTFDDECFWIHNGICLDDYFKHRLEQKDAGFIVQMNVLDSAGDYECESIWALHYRISEFYLGLWKLLQAIKDKYPEKNLFPDDDFNYYMDHKIFKEWQKKLK